MGLKDTTQKMQFLDTIKKVVSLGALIQNAKGAGKSVSRLCRPVSFGLVIIAPSRGVESPVPTCVHTLAWTAADECYENPQKNKLVVFGVDEPNSSEPVKGLKEGVFQV